MALTQHFAYKYTYMSRKKGKSNLWVDHENPGLQWKVAEIYLMICKWPPSVAAILEMDKAFPQGQPFFLSGHVFLKGQRWYYLKYLGAPYWPDNVKYMQLSFTVIIT